MSLCRGAEGSEALNHVLSENAQGDYSSVSSLCHLGSASLIGFCSKFNVLSTVFRVQIQKGVPASGAK